MASHSDFFLTGNTITLSQVRVDTAHEHVFQIKVMLLAAGWTVGASGDGLAAYSSSGDVITQALSGANGMGNALAWYRMVSPDGVYEITMQMIVVGTNHRVRIKINGGTSGAFDVGGSATQTPGISSGIERIIGGGGTDAAPTGHLFWVSSSSSNNTTAYGVAETVFPYRFWIQAQTHFNPYSQGGVLILDHCPEAEAGENGYVLHVAATSLGGSETILEFVSGTTTSPQHSYATIDGAIRKVSLTRANHSDIAVPGHPTTNNSLMMNVTWARGDSFTPNGPYGRSTLLLKNIPHAPGNLDRRRQFNTVYGDRSHAFLDKYMLPWPSMTAFNHAGTGGVDWVTRDKILYESTLATVHPDNATGGVDTTSPVIQNLTPANMSEINRHDPIQFDAFDDGPDVKAVLIWIKYEGKDVPEIVYDGTQFYGAFTNDATSVEDLSAGASTNLRFILHPSGGWVYNIEKLTVLAIDGHGNFDTD